MPGLTALIPLDGTKLSESAFALLPFIKRLGFSKVRLVSVWESVWEEQESLPGSPTEREETDERGRAYLTAYLASRAGEVRAQGLEVEEVVRVGRAAEETLAVADAEADLVLIATHGRSGAARWWLGSVADKIVRGASCPVLVIGPNVTVALDPFALRRLLVPLDGSQQAEQALALADWIASLTGAEIDLVRAISLMPVAYDPGMGLYPVDLLTTMEDAARTYLERVATRLKTSKVRQTLLIGSAGERILDHMKEEPAQLVVMATRGRSGLARLALGSVADRVLHGSAPVLLFRVDAAAKSRLLAAARGVA